MSEEMAVSVNTTGEETNVNSEETAAPTVAEPEAAAPEQVEEPVVPAPEESPSSMADSPPPEVDPEEQGEPALPIDVKKELQPDELDIPAEAIKVEVDADVKAEDEELPNVAEAYEGNGDVKDEKKGIKRRASTAFSDTADEEFKGFFDIKEEIKTEGYNRVLDGSRPSSALSTKSDSDGSTDLQHLPYHSTNRCLPSSMDRPALPEASPSPMTFSINISSHIFIKRHIFITQNTFALRYTMNFIPALQGLIQRPLQSNKHLPIIHSVYIKSFICSHSGDSAPQCDSRAIPLGQSTGCNIRYEHIVVWELIIFEVIAVSHFEC